MWSLPHCRAVLQVDGQFGLRHTHTHNWNSGSTAATNCNWIAMIRDHQNTSVSCANRQPMKPHFNHLESVTLDSNVPLLAMTIYWQLNLPVHLTSWKKERKRERKKERSDCYANIPIFKLSTHNWAPWLGVGKKNHFTVIHLAFTSYTHAQKAP